MGLADTIFIIAAAMLHQTTAQEAQIELTAFNCEAPWKTQIFALDGACQPSSEPVPAAEVRALREVVKAGVVALPPEQRERLQELSGRAVERSLVLR